jgi:hypothetical protein
MVFKRGEQIFQKSRSNFKILGAKKLVVAKAEIFASLVVNITVLLSGGFWLLAWYGIYSVKVVLPYMFAFHIIYILDEANY